MKDEKHFLSIAELNRNELMSLIKNAIRIKKHPKMFSSKLKDKTLLMIFEAPSLRTRLSFEVGMTQLGGHGIYYNLGESTLGKKENIDDLARTVSRYCDIAMARIYSHEMLLALAKHSSIPVINAMTNAEHPCQIMADLMTIYEKRKKFSGLKLAYLGDGDNNVTYSLLYGCAIAGVDIVVASPKGAMPQKSVVATAKKIAKNSASVMVTTNPKEAAKDADIIYTDSWMSYRIPSGEEPKRVKIFSPYQVNKKLFSLAKNPLFMHCLPAKRGQEVTNDIIDSKHSIVFDQAENRLHMQKAIMLWLLGKK
ncbi:MAG: ornithine carbamoyltransferase [Candidatus Aenigmatarchaeota archaeon]